MTIIIFSKVSFFTYILLQLVNLTFLNQVFFCKIHIAKLFLKYIPSQVWQLDKKTKKVYGILHYQGLFYVIRPKTKVIIQKLIKRST